jgi:predicted ATPase
VAQKLYRRTEGHPFFMVTLIDECLRHGVMSVDREWATTSQQKALEKTIPQSVQMMIEQQFERLAEEEQQVLEAASVAGLEFTAAAVAEAPTDMVQDALCGIGARVGSYSRIELTNG